MTHDNILEFKKPPIQGVSSESLFSEAAFKDNILEFKSSSPKIENDEDFYHKYIGNIIWAPKTFIDPKRYNKLMRYLLHTESDTYKCISNHWVSSSILNKISSYDYNVQRYSCMIDFMIFHHIEHERYELPAENNIRVFAYGFTAYIYNLETKKESICHYILNSTFTAYPFLSKWVKLPINLLFF